MDKLEADLVLAALDDVARMREAIAAITVRLDLIEKRMAPLAPDAATMMQDSRYYVAPEETAVKISDLLGEDEGEE